MYKMNCSKCGCEFESNGTSSLCANCRRRRNTNLYLVIAIIILILGFIGGIVLGDTYKSIDLSSITSDYDDYKESFNTALMIYSWTATVLFDLFIFAIHSICYRLDLLIDNKNKK